MSPRRQRITAALVYSALVAAMVVALFPFWWMIDTSLKRPVDIFSGVALWPQHLTGSNYHRLFASYHFGSFLVNSILVVAASVLVSLVLGTLAAYGLARFRLRFGVDRLALYGVLLVRMLPGILLVVPLYIVLAKWGILNTRLGLILIYAGLNTSFVIWMMQSFLEEIPRDIEEAAMVDGMSRLGAFVRVILPMSVAGLLTVVIFTFTLVMQEFVYGLTFINSGRNFTVSVGVPSFLVRGDVYFWGSLMGACFIASVPIAFLYNLFVDRFIAGFTVGAVKG